VYWNALEEAGEIPEWPTTTVVEYAANPKFIQSLSERIDEGLQRFPSEVRDDVHLLFSAHGTPLKEMTDRRDPYCCLVHSTVEQVMRHRDFDRPFHSAFQSKVGPVNWLAPSTPDKLEELADAGHTSVLVVPVAFVTDHIETSFELDIEVREEAEEFGIEHYEVTSGLNSHPLPASGDGVPTEGEYPLRPLDQLPRYSAEKRDTRCPQCDCITEARCWTGDPETADVQTNGQQQVAESKAQT
ncbi:MAG: ferrochelatase, partial [Bacteroidetes bacterium]|jgi:ferrochelatase|nr:ferrochelatase [Bacteroidota bacterium]